MTDGKDSVRASYVLDMLISVLFLRKQTDVKECAKHVPLGSSWWDDDARDQIQLDPF